jgi:hypothetical protein
MWQSVKEYVRAVCQWWWVVVMGIFFAGIEVLLIFWQGFVIPIWVGIALAILGLFIAQFLAFHELRVKQAQPCENWIDAYKNRHGKLPPLPDYLLPVVENYSRGEPVSRTMRLKIPSGQFWHGLPPSQQDELKELVKWLGQDPRDYLAQMERMLPKKAPEGAARWKPPEQR